ncbi:MAG: hypothetical protein ACLPL5_08310, partial [Stellaceae bacterium]
GSLLFDISAACTFCGPGSSYPGEVEILLGGMPLDGPVASIPGTSGVYISGVLFTGTIESQDGSVSIPLTDPDATRLGLPAGDLLLTPGSVSGGSYSGPVDLLSAEVALTAQEAAELFASGEAVIDLHNAGDLLVLRRVGDIGGAHHQHQAAGNVVRGDDVAVDHGNDAAFLGQAVPDRSGGKDQKQQAN